MLWSTQIIPNDSSEEERRKAPMEIHKYAHTENFCPVNSVNKGYSVRLNSYCYQSLYVTFPLNVKMSRTQSPHEM